MRRTFLAAVAVLATAMLIALVMACRPHLVEVFSPPPREAPMPAPEFIPTVMLEADRRVGAGQSFEDLTVFPILSQDQPDLGPFVTLEKALADGTAEVREKDRHGQVASLVLENKGTRSIFVLAGTVVKGGKQDRQIGQDFAVGPQQTVAIDAFCVEQRRWNASRNGQATHGKFGTGKTLATTPVRTAGQYKKDQGEVWSKVGEVNASNKKVSATGSLSASLDDQELGVQRAALAQRVATFVDTLEPQKDVIGVAYAVEGRVKSVRWFANHDLYAMYRESLFNTAALEAITAQRAAGDQPRPPSTPPTPDAVKAFFTEIEAAQVAEERATPGENVNSYKESKGGYGSSATLKTAPSSWSSPSKDGKVHPSKKSKATISSDFVAK